MFKLIKHLKPFTGLIITAIILLFIQAMADLSLPNYMSNIINIGIQQGGIENSVPDAVRESKMKKLGLFMDESSKSRVFDNYMLIDKSSKEYDLYLDLYPGLKKEPIYVLKNRAEKDNELNMIMGKAFMAVSAIKELENTDVNKYMDFNINTMDESTVFIMMESLSEADRIKIRDELNRNLLGDEMIVQGAVGLIKSEYEALGINMDKRQNRYILDTGIRMLIVSFISAVSIVGVGFFASKTGTGLARNLRKSLFTKVESFSKVELDKFSTASLITRTTNDITQIQMLIVIMIRMVFYAPIMGIGGIIRALDKNPSMSWIIALAVFALLLLIGVVFIMALPKFKVIQKLVDKLNLITRENLSGMMVIRAFNTQAFEEKRFDTANENLTNTNLFVNRIMVVLFPTMMLIMNLTTLLIVWVGAKQIAVSSMQVGDMMAFIQYAMQIIFAFIMMSYIFIMVPRASVAVQRISEVLETEVKITDPIKSKKFYGEPQGVVEFKRVFFKYEGADEHMLKNISFKAIPGQITAIIGSTGSGKSTLVNLIPRLYDVTEGQVLVDGVDVREIEQYDLRNKIGFVPQKSILFSGTIESNLRYADENASKEDLWEAAEIAQSKEFVSEKTQGLFSEISQGGANVSGGQKQRLAIARALMKKPEVFVFDDSFSALDFTTDAAIRKNLKEKLSSSTIIIVAQRVATIMKAEQIIVLDEGRVVGIGTHKELLKMCKTYEEIALSQLSREELA